MVNTMEFPWKLAIDHGFVLFVLSIHGISSGVLSIAIEKTWVFHEKPMGFPRSI